MYNCTYIYGISQESSSYVAVYVNTHIGKNVYERISTATKNADQGTLYKCIDVILINLLELRSKIKQIISYVHTNKSIIIYTEEHYTLLYKHRISTKIQCYKSIKWITKELAYEHYVCT